MGWMGVGEKGSRQLGSSLCQTQVRKFQKTSLSLSPSKVCFYHSIWNGTSWFSCQFPSHPRPPPTDVDLHQIRCWGWLNRVPKSPSGLGTEQSHQMERLVSVAVTEVLLKNSFTCCWEGAKFLARGSKYWEPRQGEGIRLWEAGTDRAGGTALGHSLIKPNEQMLSA